MVFKLRLLAWALLFLGCAVGLGQGWLLALLCVTVVLRAADLVHTDDPTPPPPVAARPDLGIVVPPRTRPRTPLGRAVALRLEQPRFEDQGADELVSGRVDERRVTLRLGPGLHATLSFDLPWRAAYDLVSGTLPPEVEARLAAGGGPGDLEDPEAALVDLFGALRCVRLRAGARRAHATLRVDGIAEADAPAWARRAVAVTTRLDGLVRTPIVVDRASIDGADLVCPYCRDSVAGAGATPCAACGTLHHDECFAEAGGCTILGCSAQPRREPRPGLRTG